VITFDVRAIPPNLKWSFYTYSIESIRLNTLTYIVFRMESIKILRGEQREAIPLTAKAVSFLALIL